MKLHEFLTGFIIMGFVILAAHAFSDKAEACGDIDPNPVPVVKVVVA